jgi:predicted amidophosphoribosyltransferase
MNLEETFSIFAALLTSMNVESDLKFELSQSLVIICPDCGKNIAFRGRCPKCGGDSWIPAGHNGGVFEQLKAQRWRQLIAADVDSTVLRESRPVAVGNENLSELTN